MARSEEGENTIPGGIFLQVRNRDEEAMDNINSVTMHDTEVVRENITRVRVEGGWIYMFYGYISGHGHCTQLVSTSFVPDLGRS